MTEHDPMEAYLDDFGARLAPATPPPRRAPHLRPIGLVAAIAVAVLVVAAVAISGSGNSLDPVAEAQAALAQPGEIVYMKITSTSVRGSFNSVPPPRTTEQWSTLDPPRWRFVQTIPPPGGRGGSVGDAHGPIAGRQEFSYANGEQRSYIAERDTLDVRQGYGDDGPAARVPSLLGVGSGDIQTDLRSMLGDGEVTDQGEQQVNGRTVRRLVSEQHTTPSPTADSSRKPAQPTGGTISRRLVYDVDPETFAPIDGWLTFHVPSSPQPLSVTTRMHVDDYKRIPLNDTTAKLLEIQTTPKTKVTVHTAQELREQQQRMREQCRPRKNGDKVCKPFAPLASPTKKTAP